MVRDKKLTPENTQGALKIVDSSDVDYSQYTYAAMKGNNIASKSVVYRNKYQDKVYILLLISNISQMMENGQQFMMQQKMTILM